MPGGAGRQGDDRDPRQRQDTAGEEPDAKARKAMVADAEAEVGYRHPIKAEEAKGEPPGPRGNREHGYETGGGIALAHPAGCER